MAKTQKTKDWQNLPDDEILQMRVRDLHVQVSGSAVEPLVNRLYAELDAKGINFRPPCYLTDEWLCPDKVPIIGIPFCLAHPRLKSIEQKMMLEVEGGTEQSCMKLLRHECGHALNYAYKLYQRTRWRELFGRFTAKYSDYYLFQPYSRRFVIHLQDYYAQAHPDEDFAETFAVWLTPDSAWQMKYRHWPVIKKLLYVDCLMSRVCNKSPLVTPRQKPPWSASRMTSTLAAYYQRKRAALGTEFQGFYDDSLRTLFTAKHSDSKIRASKLLRRHRRRITGSVAGWTGHRKYDINQLVNKFIARCEALQLYAASNETENVIGLTALLTTIANSTLTITKSKRK